MANQPPRRAVMKLPPQFPEEMMKPKTAAEPGTNSEPLPLHSEHEEVTRQLVLCFSMKKKMD